MNHQSDQQLLQYYVNEKSQFAFEVIVSRYRAKVYATALKIIRNPAMAEDVTQLVFLNLAKSASVLTDRKVLEPWLNQVAHNLAVGIIRSEERRKRREQTYRDLDSHEVVEKWEKLRPLLDDCLFKLPLEDRKILTYHYLENKTFSEVANLCGLKENTARKKAQRALIKLSSILKGRNMCAPALLLQPFFGLSSLKEATHQLGVKAMRCLSSKIRQIMEISKRAKVFNALSLAFAGVAAFVIVRGDNANQAAKSVLLVNKGGSDEYSSCCDLFCSLEPQSNETCINESDSKTSNEKQSKLSWWQQIYSKDLRQMVKNLKMAGFPDSEIDALFSTKTLKATLKSKSQLAHILADLREEELEESYVLKDLWPKMNQEYAQGAYSTLKKGNLTEEFYQVFLERLELSYQSKNKEQSQNIAKSNALPKRGSIISKQANSKSAVRENVHAEAFAKSKKSDSDHEVLLVNNNKMRRGKLNLRGLTEMHAVKNLVAKSASIAEEVKDTSSRTPTPTGNVEESGVIGGDGQGGSELASTPIGNIEESGVVGQESSGFEEELAVLLIGELIENLEKNLEALSFSAVNDSLLLAKEQQAMRLSAPRALIDKSQNKQNLDMVEPLLGGAASIQNTALSMIERTFERINVQLEQMNLVNENKLRSEILNEKERMVDFELGLTIHNN